MPRNWLGERRQQLVVQPGTANITVEFLPGSMDSVLFNHDTKKQVYRGSYSACELALHQYRGGYHPEFDSVLEVTSPV